MKEKIRKILEEEKTFLLATHIHPDADGLASMLAMTLAFRAQGKEAWPLVETSPPETLDFLHGYGELLSLDGDRDLPFEPSEAVALVFDLSEAHRLGKVAELVLVARERILFDHHAETGEPLPGIQVIDPSAAASALLVFRLLKDLGWPISQEVAENLLAGLYSDTGGFRFENTREETFLAAAELVRLGARPTFVGEKLVENQSPARLALMQKVLERREFLLEGRGVLSYLTLADLKEVGARPEDTEDLATFLRSMRGVEIAVLVKEIRPGEIGVSLRSRGSVDVARLASREGGGGHRRAAGFRQREKSLEEVLRLVRHQILEVLGG